MFFLQLFLLLLLLLLLLLTKYLRPLIARATPLHCVILYGAIYNATFSIPSVCGFTFKYVSSWAVWQHEAGGGAGRVRGSPKCQGCMA